MLAQITNTHPIWQFLSYSKDSFSSLESCFKVAAIVVGGIWAWRAFSRKREKFPKAKVIHSVRFWDISESERLIRIGLCIDNTSAVLLKIEKGYTWIQQMIPWPEKFVEAFKAPEQKPKQSSEFAWPLIEEKDFDGEKEIEPGESDEFTMEFVVNKCFEQVLVYSYLENAGKPGQNIGWTASTVVNFSELSDAKNTGEIRDESEGQTKEKLKPEKAAKNEKGKKH
jgi:hypothetical protein